MQSKQTPNEKKKLTEMIITSCQLEYSPSLVPTSCDIKTGNIETAFNYQFIWLQIKTLLEINNVWLCVVYSFFGFKVKGIKDLGNF